MTIRKTELPQRLVLAPEVMKLLQGAEDIGINIAALLKRARIPYSPQDFHTGLVSSVPQFMYTDIYREYVLALEIEASRKSGRPPVTQEEFGLMWLNVITCRTLGDAINRAAAFSRMLEGRMGEIAIGQSDGIANFRLNSLRLEQTPSTVMTEAIGLAMFERMFSWLIDEPLGVNVIDLRYPESFATCITPDIVPIPLNFDCKSSGFSFPANLLDRSIIRTAEELEEILPLTILSVSTSSTEGILTRRVRHLLDEAIIHRSSLPVIEKLSETLNISQASLRRGLAGEGTSIRKLKNQCRLYWALELLRQPGMQIAEIADRLSFSDETAFRRSFRQWTGKPPSACRG